ncbi:aminopeptidase [Asanoa ishikariensis]|uniref:Peptidase family M28 n=1 Tax=Asanoa ishikariensis TaxID=137265 RepID=A0A1H3LT30_9ACTN|nr:M28 family peptidase [Asanoa ishikariensis]GIF65688.1 aminopeptidase [Asanoa ishikariensis]SDY67707.1 Peptidase family M28 [Asanoa ishikariensis]
MSAGVQESTTPAQVPADRALARPPRRALTALVAVVVLGAIGAISLLDIRPPAPKPVSAPAGEFSAGRAAVHIDTVAARTHVAGSAANDTVRDYLVRTLSGFGLRTTVQDAIGGEAGDLSGSSGAAAVAHVRNVVAELPGSDPTGTVFLVAHYDSVQVGPGGNDDGAGTSSVVEVARALTQAGPPRNNVVFVLTDAEEACLCGALAFAANHPLAKDGGVALNLEARGSTGPVIMFETSRDNAKLVDVFARSAPHPVGTSFAVEVYRLLPNDTDFTAFLGNDFVGLNSAYIDGGALYHTPLDTPASVDKRTLQQHGDNALGLVRAFGATDLGALRASGDATYFPVPGTLIVYPGWLTWPLAGVALLLVAALAVLTVRSGRATWGRVAGGFGLALVPIIAAPLAAQLLWMLVTALRPGYVSLLDPYRPMLWRLTVVLLATAVLFTWYALLRRRMGPAALAIGGLGWLAVLGLVLAALTPGGSYLAALPALAGALGALVALRLRDAWTVVPLTVAAAVGVVILAPTVVLLFPALGMAMGGVGALFATLLGLAALPVLDLLLPAAGGQRGLTALRARRIGLGVPVLALVATLAVGGTAFAVDRFDPAHPVPTHLMYALDTDDGQAKWVSYESSPQSWTAGYVSATEDLAATFPEIGGAEVLTGPAEAASLPAAAVTVVADSVSGGSRTMRLKVVPQRPVRLAALHVDGASAAVEKASVGGFPVPVDASEPWSFGLIFHAPPADGFEVELVLRPTGSGPVRVRVEDGSDGLENMPGFRPRPPGVGVMGSHSSELVLVAKTYTF